MIWVIFLLIFISVTLLIYELIPVFRLRADTFFQQALKQAESDVESLYLHFQAKQVLHLTIICTLTFLVIGLIVSKGSLIFGALMGVSGFFLPKAFFYIQKARRKDKLNAQLVSAIEMLANAMKAGTNLHQALKLVPQEMETPISQEFAVLLREMELGLKLEDALNNLVKRTESSEYELVATAINVSRESGGNLAEVFDRIADTIRERFLMLGKIKTLTAEGKMQGLFVGVLPFLLGILMMIIDPDKMVPFFTSFIGYILLGVVLLLVLMGMFLIRKITTIEV